MRGGTYHESVQMGDGPVSEAGTAALDVWKAGVDCKRHQTSWCSLCKPQPPAAEPPTLVQVKAQFPTPGLVAAPTQERVGDLKERYLQLQPEPDPAAAPFRAKYRQLFSAEGLAGCSPADMWTFLTSTVLADPGDRRGIYGTWKEVGERAATQSIRDTIEYLLRGPASVGEEDRLSELVRSDFGTKGFKEALLTKVLCVTQPERFLPLVVYSGTWGKRAIATEVFGLALPVAAASGMTRGRLAYWSNDLLRDLAGPEFVDTEHAKHFLWCVLQEVRGQPSIFAGSARSGPRLDTVDLTDLDADAVPASVAESGDVTDMPDGADLSDPADVVLTAVVRDLTGGQGYSGDPHEVERVGMDRVIAYFKDQDAGWVVTAVDQDKCGWDITAVRGDERWCVEVKAISGPAPRVFVTANELRHATATPGWVMAVVTRALSSPDPVCFFTAADVLAAAEPKVYQAKLEPADGTAEPQTRSVSVGTEDERAADVATG